MNNPKSTSRSLKNAKEKGMVDPYTAILYDLYQNPLYRYMDPEKRELKILVIGFNAYGQKFMDACLQMGQMKDVQLSIYVFSKGEEETWLAERPALKESFNIDGSLNRKENCGNIFFRRLDDANVSATQLSDIFYEFYTKNKVRYVLISTGNRRTNQSLAGRCAKRIKEETPGCTIRYISEKDTEDDLALCVKADLSKHPLYEDIERMAFNTHLIWEKNLNSDRTRIHREFRDPYNHDSSVSSAISVKYKLFSIGIDLDQVTFQQAANTYWNRKLADPNKRSDTVNILIHLEHRRWMTEKICQGWSAITDLEECAGGMTKDSKNRRHICLVPSSPNQKLAEEFNHDGRHTKWDGAAAEELNQLDELDRMSVMLHRMYRRHALMVRETDLINGDIISSIRRFSDHDPKTMRAFQEWYACVTDIWNGDPLKGRLYVSLKQQLTENASLLPSGQARALRSQINAFDTVFYPVRAAEQYFDWKQLDTALIRNIPFILTYTEKAYAVIPFQTGNNTDLFNNVAAVTVSGPEHILYLYFAENVKDLEDLRYSLPNVFRHLKRRKIKAKCDMILLCLDKYRKYVSESYEMKLREASLNGIHMIRTISAEKPDELPDLLKDYLIQRRKGKKAFLAEKNDTKLSYLLMGAGFYDSFDSYRFNSQNMSFYELTGNTMYRYIRKSPYISIADMMAFLKTSGDVGHQPEFYSDYRDLWAQYKNSKFAWKQMCNQLGTYAEEKDEIAGFQRKDNKTAPAELRFVLPYECMNSVSRILDELKKRGVAERDSRVQGYRSDSCEVLIWDCYDNGSLYAKLFSRVYELMQDQAISLDYITRVKKVIVRFNGLMVRNLMITGSGKSEIINLLKWLSERNYLNNLNITDDKVSFVYGSLQIKDLLTAAGRILEIYVYHKAKDSGAFDDIRSGYEINWEDKDIQSEFDCILTKGFSTIFVECKAVYELDQDYYYKLKSLTDRFGVNAKAVIVADTNENYRSNPENDVQRERGRMIGVFTIWKADEISNIDMTLTKILKGTYESE